MALKILQIAGWLVAFYIISEIIGYYYRKSWFFNQYSLLKTHYLMLLDIDLFALMLKNHSVNEQGKVVGFEDMKGGLLPYNKVFDLFHVNNVRLNLGLYVNKNDIHKNVIKFLNVSIQLFEELSNTNKNTNREKYNEIVEFINQLYLDVRLSIINFQKIQNKILVNLKSFDEPKSLQETKVIQFIKI